MWVLSNDTPYAAERNWTRDKQGVHQWLVAVRATYAIGAGGKLKLLDEQPPPALAPEYRGEPGKSSLAFDSDLLAYKPTTDVVLDASAHAPRGKPATTVPVSLRVGELEKVLVVHGPRVYYKGAGGLTTTAPRAFETQRITYEAAFGGYDTTPPDPRKHRLDARNPVGRGIAAAPDHLEHQPAHTIEYPSGNASKLGPAGFGPIDRAWSPRLELAGTYDAAWEKSKKPLLPDDYDERFALCAPVDQRSPKHLRGGETITLVNMTPDGALRFDLPKLFFTFATRFGRRIEEHSSHLTTVFVETDKLRVSVVWQTALTVPGRQVEQLDETAISQKEYLR